LEAAALVVAPVVSGASVRDKTQPKPDEHEDGEDEEQDKQARAADAI
jgi:hypothetical protein